MILTIIPSLLSVAPYLTFVLIPLVSITFGLESLSNIIIRWMVYVGARRMVIQLDQFTVSESVIRPVTTLYDWACEPRITRISLASVVAMARNG